MYMVRHDNKRIERHPWEALRQRFPGLPLNCVELRNLEQRIMRAGSYRHKVTPRPGIIVFGQPGRPPVVLIGLILLALLRAHKTLPYPFATFPPSYPDSRRLDIGILPTFI